MEDATGTCSCDYCGDEAARGGTAYCRERACYRGRVSGWREHEGDRGPTYTAVPCCDEQKYLIDQWLAKSIPCVVCTQPIPITSKLPLCFRCERAVHAARADAERQGRRPWIVQ